MRKVLSLVLCAVLICASVALGESQPLTGKANGFKSLVEVAVTMDGDKIANVEVLSHDETNGIGTLAVEQLPAAIIAANSADVDVIASATVTSNAIMAAVKNAIDPENNPYEAPQAEVEKTPAQVSAADAYIGFGLSSSGRLGPGKDDTDTQVYSINQVFANVIFDAEGKILYGYVDQLEVATPNYDGASMPHFSGFTGQSYNNDSDHNEKVDGTITVTDDSFLEEIASWQTKRERGADYVMGTGTWASQMDAFQEIFVGKTVEEVEEWFTKYCSDRNGRPLKAGSENEEDAAKYNALTDEEKTMLIDVTSSATMSLNDSHGNILAALKNAYENRLPLTAESASGIGFGFDALGRLGPGKDDTETQVYSFNEVYATTLFDAEGKIASIHIDQLEVATPNYDGDSMPHFSGFPGQGGYNLDADHDGKVDGKTEVNDDTFMEEINSWQTKRDRGAGYVMGTGTWESQMDAFQQLFVGKTIEEVEEWFAKYCSDRNGRPLKAGSENEEDAAKYNALTDNEKAMLTDVTSSATMSLNDSHGNILAAIRNSFESQVKVDLAIQK